MAKYRPNVGIVVFNSNLKVLLCASADRKDFQWQFPQGGIETGEEIVAAARRELQEETGIRSVELVAKLPQPLRYDFPRQVAEAQARKGIPFIGQEQHWVLFYFYGKDSEIDFCTNPQEIEFKAYEWTDISEAPKRIISFKKEVYQKVQAAFTPYICSKKNRIFGSALSFRKIIDRFRAFCRDRIRGGR